MEYGLKKGINPLWRYLRNLKINDDNICNLKNIICLKNKE